MRWVADGLAKRWRPTASSCLRWFRRRPRSSARSRLNVPAYSSCLPLRVVIGAGDRLRGGRNRRLKYTPMVSWGTTAERLRPCDGRSAPACGRFGLVRRARRLRGRSRPLDRGRGGVVGVTHGANARRALSARSRWNPAPASWSPCRGSPARGPWWRPDATPRSSASPTRTDRRAGARRRRGIAARRRPLSRAHRTGTRRARRRRRGRRTTALAQHARRGDPSTRTPPRGRRRCRSAPG